MHDFWWPSQSGNLLQNQRLYCGLGHCLEPVPQVVASHHAVILQSRPQRVLLPADIPFAQAAPLLVQPPVPEAGTADGFIDDVFSANVVTDKNAQADRLAQAVLLAMEILGRPNSKFEPLLRDMLLSLEKANAKGTPNELLIVLGWLLDTRRLIISLPQDKFVAWTNDLKAIINPPPSARGYLRDHSSNPSPADSKTWPRSSHWSVTS
jgi:hypothetical protein